MEGKRMGKLNKVRFGLGGYQGRQFGLTVDITGDGWGVGDFVGWWDSSMKWDENKKWTEEDRLGEWAKAARLTEKLLHQAKKRDIKELEGVPVEVTFKGNSLESWRILEEVL